MYLSYDTVPKNAVILSIPDTVSQILPHPGGNGEVTSQNVCKVTMVGQTRRISAFQQFQIITAVDGGLGNEST